MQIAQNKVVNIHYTLRSTTGLVLDSSVEREPLVYIHGSGSLVPGVEKALEGHKAGDKFSFDVAPAEGYGVRDDSLVQNVPRSAFGNIADVRVGMQFEADSNHGPRTVVVTSVGPDTVTIDGNHPLAGQTLHFEVEVTEVRAATEHELDQGHVQQGCGCGHSH